MVIDVLGNNAGYGYMAAVEEGEDDEVRTMFDSNYFGAVDMIKAVLPTRIPSAPARSSLGLRAANFPAIPELSRKRS